MNVSAGEDLSFSPTFGKGICNGILGLVVAEVGRGGSERISGVNPGISSTTTFGIDWGFCICHQC